MLKIQALQKLRQKDCPEFQARLESTVNFTITWDTLP